MKVSVTVIATALVCACLIMGCGQGADGDLKLVPVTGVVTYNGGPLAGATIIFMPEKGPLAMGVTDTKGEFKLASGALLGCAVGPSVVAVKVDTPGQGSSSAAKMTPGANSPPEDMAAQSKKMAEMTMSYQADAANKPKSLIPERYADAKSSGLQFTVETDAAKNNFKIELKD